MCNRHRIITARDQYDMLAPWRTADIAGVIGGVGDEDDRHPDLHHALRMHGSVHTTGGRVLYGHRTAAAFHDPAGWQPSKGFTPSQHAMAGATAYTSLMGLQDPHAGHINYQGAIRTPESVQSVGRHYDSLPNLDKSSLPSFNAMRDEVNKQHDFMTNRLGIRTQAVDHDPYPDVHAMVDDVNKNKTLKVMGTAVTGGHPYFSDDDNDKFRAVHDFFGHAATGRSFDRHGEQAAYLAHAQMFSPHALGALTSETAGQNSSLILNGQFGPQKVAAMHPDIVKGLGSHLARRRVSSYRRIAGRFDDAWKEDVMNVINHPETGGGYTLRDKPGDGPTSGTMVSLPRAEGHEEAFPVRGLSGDAVADYVDRKWDPVHEHPDNFAGGWANTGEGGDDQFYQDISRNYSDPWEAAGDAMKGGQLGVYDLDGYYTHDHSPSAVDTPSFFHDQIAKGGNRAR